MITGNHLSYLCAILNSRLYRFYFSLILGGNSYAYGARDVFIEIPVLQDFSAETEIHTAVKRIMDVNDHSAEEQIDALIYSLFKLTDTEIRYLKGE